MDIPSREEFNTLSEECLWLKKRIEAIELKVGAESSAPAGSTDEERPTTGDYDDDKTPEQPEPGSKY